MDLINNYESDFLLDTLTSIASEFEKHNIPTIVGGGFSLYLKSRFLEKKEVPDILIKHLCDQQKILMSF